MTRLQGITWDHPRGDQPLQELSTHNEIQVDWKIRSLQDFGDFPLHVLAEKFDLIILDHPHIAEAAQGILRPLNDFLSPEVLAQHAMQSVGKSFASYQIEEKQWALPIDSACLCSAFNVDYFGTIPRMDTWNHFFTLAEKLKQDNKKILTPFHPTDANCIFLSLLAQTKNPIESIEDFHSESVIKVLTLLRNIYQQSEPESLDMNPIDVLEKMAENDDYVYSPVLFNYSNYSRENSSKHPLQFTNIPGIHSGLLGGAGIGISAKSEYPAEAATYIEYICSSEVQSQGYVKAMGQPANLAAWKSDYANSITNEFFKNSLNAIELAYMRPRLVGWPDFQEKLGHSIHKHLKENHSIDYTIKKIQQACQLNIKT